MSLFFCICIGYIVFCLLCSVLIPCLRHTWKSLYDEEIKETDERETLFKILSDVSKQRKNIFLKVGTIILIVMVVLILFFLLLLAMPFCIYWLNKSYKIDKKLQKENEKFEKQWAEIEEFFPETPIRKEYLSAPLVIKFKDNVPFIPDNKQVIYIESEYNEPLNYYISKKYEKIVAVFKSGYRKFDFIYLPRYIKKLTDNGNEMLKYSFPGLNSENIYLNDGVVARHILENILSYSDKSDQLNGGLMRYIETKDNCHIFKFFQFRNFEENEIFEQFRAYISMVGDAQLQPLFSISRIGKTDDEIPEDAADNSFPYAAQNLIDEIKERIELLRQTGISELALKSLFKFDDAVKLSKIQITKDYRIFLPDYNHLEITMTPLPKAVYFLFLKHPEGILFKHLPDYRDELMNIYKHISNRENLTDMEKSIDDVTDPTKNAINEKCSRIREAFIRHFDESLAQNYFITGLRSEPKTITLDRQLVAWESKW